MKIIDTKSTNMNDIILYFAMFSTTIDKILCFIGPRNMKMSHYFSVLDPIWNLGPPPPKKTKSSRSKKSQVPVRIQR